MEICFHTSSLVGAIIYIYRRIYLHTQRTRDAPHTSYDDMRSYSYGIVCLSIHIRDFPLYD